MLRSSDLNQATLCTLGGLNICRAGNPPVLFPGEALPFEVNRCDCFANVFDFYGCPGASYCATLHMARAWRSFNGLDGLLDRHQGRPIFSKRRRSGWRQKTLRPKRNAYSQPSGFSTRHSEKSRVCPRCLVRHCSGSVRRH